MTSFKNQCKIIYMSDYIKPDYEMRFSIHDAKEQKNVLAIAKALDSPEKIAVMQAIALRPINVWELARATGIPRTTVSRYVEDLARAQLIFLNYRPGKKGHTKVCNKTALNVEFLFEDLMIQNNPLTHFLEMPIGMYFDFKVGGTCGMLGINGAIGDMDDPSVFYDPKRMEAECIWFNSGFLSYNFPYKKSVNSLDSLEFSFEICSETGYYNDNWPSDITVFVNDVEILTFTSPGDFGGRRGKYTPEYWPVISTQFGLLKHILITENGISLDNTFLKKSPALSELKIDSSNHINLKIGIKEDAVHIGGINLFGKNFGDYPQAIIMALKYLKSGITVK